MDRSASGPSATAPRYATIDAVRGFAVLGIVVMNIVSMGEPGYAYVDPNYYGGASGANLLFWALQYALAEGKMRMLFSMLFGASLAIVADATAGREPGPAAVHCHRMAWLLLFGMIHAWLFWYGDILVEYALCGLPVFAARRWPPVRLFAVAGLSFAASVTLSLIEWHDLTALKAAATARGAPPHALAAWTQVREFAAPPAGVIARELGLYRGGFADAFAARMPMTLHFQTGVIWLGIPSTLAFMLAGIALYRTGFLTGDWSRRSYLAMVAAGYGIALPLTWPLIRMIVAARFDPAVLPLADALTLLLRPWVGLAHASVVILAVRAGTARWLTDRLAAAGRMALSNYLGTTLIATTLFYGYGFGLFGRLLRAELMWVVLGIWAAILLWSKPWLARFHYGPLEWAWRILARSTAQPMRRTAIASGFH